MQYLTLIRLQPDCLPKEVEVSCGLKGFQPLTKYSSWSFASPKAATKFRGASIRNGKRISSLSPLRKQLSLYLSKRPRRWLDND